MEKLLIIFLITSLISCGKQEEETQKNNKNQSYKIGETNILTTSIDLDEQYTQIFFIPKQHFREIHLLTAGDIQEQKNTSIVHSFKLGFRGITVECSLNEHKIQKTPKEKLEFYDIYKYFDIYFDKHIVSPHRVHTVWRMAAALPGKVVKLKLILKEKYHYQFKKGYEFPKDRSCDQKKARVNGKIIKENYKLVSSTPLFEGSFLIEFEY